MNTLHSFLDPTIYLLCRKVCEYKSYTGIKNLSERKFICIYMILIQITQKRNQYNALLIKVFSDIELYYLFERRN